MAFAINLLGAVVGGALEYLALVTGYQALLIVVAGLYALAWLFATRLRLGADKELSREEHDPTSQASAGAAATSRRNRPASEARPDAAVSPRLTRWAADGQIDRHATRAERRLRCVLPRDVDRRRSMPWSSTSDRRESPVERGRARAV